MVMNKLYHRFARGGHFLINQNIGHRKMYAIAERNRKVSMKHLFTPTKSEEQQQEFELDSIVRK